MLFQAFPLFKGSVSSGTTNAADSIEDRKLKKMHQESTLVRCIESWTDSLSSHVI